MANIPNDQIAKSIVRAVAQFTQLVARRGLAPDQAAAEACSAQYLVHWQTKATDPGFEVRIYASNGDGYGTIQARLLVQDQTVRLLDTQGFHFRKELETVIQTAQFEIE